MEQQRKPTDIWLKRAAAVTVIGAASIVGIDRLNNLGILDGFGMPDVPDIPVSLKPDPPKVNASLDPEFTEVREEFDLRCRADITVAVGVRGFMNGPFGDGKVDKKYYGDFMPCSESLPGSATLIPDKDTGEIVRVKIRYASLKTTQPRIDFGDGRNCADVNADDTREEAEEAIQRRREAIENGEEPECNDGFWVSQFFAEDDVAQVKDLSLAAAQLAIEYIDPDAYAQINKKNLEDLITYYQDLYPNAIIDVTTDVVKPYMQYVEDKIAQNQKKAAEKLDSEGLPVFKSVSIEPITDGDCNDPNKAELPECYVLVAYGYSGGSARITLSDIYTDVEFESTASVNITSVNGEETKPLGPVGVDPSANNLEDFFDLNPDTTAPEPVSVGPVAPSATEPNDFFDLTD